MLIQKCGIILSRAGAVAINGSRYEATKRTIQLINVDCNSNEEVLDQCDKRLLTQKEGAVLTGIVDVAGVYCAPNVIVIPQPSYYIEAAHVKDYSTNTTIFAATIGILLLIIVLTVTRYFI